jgi:hypothetical protein
MFSPDAFRYPCIDFRVRQWIVDGVGHGETQTLTERPWMLHHRRPFQASNQLRACLNGRNAALDEGLASPVPAEVRLPLGCGGSSTAVSHMGPTSPIGHGNSRCPRVYAPSRFVTLTLLPRLLCGGKVAVLHRFTHAWRMIHTHP